MEFTKEMIDSVTENPSIDSHIRGYLSALLPDAPTRIKRGELHRLLAMALHVPATTEFAQIVRSQMMNLGWRPCIVQGRNYYRPQKRI